jgi:uracil-DNA glycosylase family 4
MKGFFSEAELSEYIDTPTALEPNCTKCGLHKKCKSPKLDVVGKGKKKVLMVIEMAGRDSDKVGEYLCGRDGNTLDSHLSDIGLDLKEDFWITGAVRCRSFKDDKTKSDTKPTKTNIKCCKPYLDLTIKKLKPDFIWLMGGTPIESFYMDRFSTLTVSRWVDLCIPDRPTGAWVIPFFHQSHIRRRNDDKNLISEFKRNIKYAKSCLGKETYKHEDLEQYTHSLTNFDSTMSFLEKLVHDTSDKPSTLYVDLETTSLKPHWKGSRIVTVSIATGTQTAYAFPFQRKDWFNFREQRKIKSLLRKLFTNPQICWIAHNKKFEDSWIRNILGVSPANWMYDTMLGAHIIDNRRKFSGLKFQSYINFGVDPYDKSVAKYLKSPPNSHENNIDKAPLKELLYYNCLDTLLGMRLFEKQQESFTLTEGLRAKNNLPNAYNLLHNGSLALSDVQENGVTVKEGYYEEKEVEVGNKIKELESKLLSSKGAKKWNDLKKRPINLASNKDLGILFYDILKEKKVLTKNNNYKVDKQTLEMMGNPFVSDLLEMRKYEKIRGTYFSQIKREVCNGVIHPFFNLHIPISYRSSSSMPNWQNQPGHDPIAGKLVREGIVPPDNWYMAEADYSSIEVKVAALYTQDPSLLKYVTDPTTDMHRDTACDIWMIPKEQVTKAIRYNSKGGWVFAQFYGSYYANCAEDLWKTTITNEECLVDGTPMIEHLHDNGIHSKAAFVEHLRGVEDIFWNQRFKVYKQWKLGINKQYRRRGFVETFYGFRFTGYMTDKETTNYPIQSTAFHILLEALTKLNNILKIDNWQSYIVGQIHDSILLYIHPDEKDALLQLCKKVMSKDIADKYNWITVPIDMEMELTNTSWWDKKEVPI